LSIFRDAHTNFLNALIKHKVEFLIIGGYAVILHGVRRTTSDMDVFIKATKENGIKLLNVFKELKLNAEGILPEEFETDLVLFFGDEPDAIDIINHTPALTFDEAFANSLVLNIDGMPLPLVDIRDLIRNKENLNREGKKSHIDKFDIEALKEIQEKKSKE
jgi:predicted nucleotidyltransferase